MLTKELQTAEATLTKARTDETAKGGAEKAYTHALVKLDALVQDRRKILKAAADKVAGKSSNLLSARLRKDRMPEEYLTALHKVFEASHTQQVEEGCQDWVKATLSADEDDGWAALRKSFIELYEAKIMAGSPPDASDGLLSACRRSSSEEEEPSPTANETESI